MELTGDLSDFALTDILQILALGRKTGMVLIDNDSVAGKIALEEGRITYASLVPGETFADRLVNTRRIGKKLLNRFKEIGERSGGLWTVETLIVESGLMQGNELQVEAIRHVKRVVERLVSLERGTFGIAVNEPSRPDSLEEIKLRDGLEVGEVLLELAHERDQGQQWNGQSRPATSPLETRDRVTRPLNDNGRGPLHSVEETPRRGVENSNATRSELLFSLLAELRFHSFEAEVSLAMMRYASEVATRGILFAVKGSELCGLGQFGVSPTGEAADSLVRELRIPLNPENLFSRVVETKMPFVGPTPRGYWDAEVLTRLGGFEHDLTVFALPLTCRDKTLYVLYGDNYPGGGELRGITELEALSSQASLVLEKIELERKLAKNGSTS